MYWASCSASRPLSQSSAAMPRKSLDILSWSGWSVIVSFACSHRAGRALRLEGVKKMVGLACNCSTMVSSFSAAPISSSSVGSSIWFGRGGTKVGHFSGGSAASSSSPVEKTSSSDAGSTTAFSGPTGPTHGVLKRYTHWSPESQYFRSLN